MKSLDIPSLANSFTSASNAVLAAILDQSADCIKVIGLTGSLDFMNRNGRCAMGIDDFALVEGMDWWDLWPEDAQPLIRDAIGKAQRGEHSRFEASCPAANGEPRWWDVSVAPLRNEQGVLRGLISISRDISADIAARELRESTATEMKHRLQNAYALTSAIVLATARGVPERESFAREIVDRLQRLGIAQSLLLDGGAIGKSTLDTLVRRLTEPFCGDSAALNIAQLPSVDLDESQVRTLALVLGEFSTNSNKYGALGHGGEIAIDGRIEGNKLHLGWRETSDRPVDAFAGFGIDGRIEGNKLHLGWRETSDRPVDAEVREGSSGLTMIRRMLGSHGGTLDIAWRADGLDISVTLPGF